MIVAENITSVDPIHNVTRHMVCITSTMREAQLVSLALARLSADTENCRTTYSILEVKPVKVVPNEED